MSYPLLLISCILSAGNNKTCPVDEQSVNHWESFDFFYYLPEAMPQSIFKDGKIYSHSLHLVEEPFPPHTPLFSMPNYVNNSNCRFSKHASELCWLYLEELKLCDTEFAKLYYCKRNVWQHLINLSKCEMFRKFNE